MKRTYIVVGTVALLLLVTIAAALIIYRQIRSADVALGRPSGELAFNSDRTGVWDVFTMAPDGTVRDLTGDGAGQDYFVSWAFNNDMLNFLSSRSGEMGPAQVRPDGSELRTLSILQAVLTVFREQRIHWDPAWSPDGERMVWSSVRDLNLEIYLADGDGENQVRLTEDGGRDWYPAWSPDGTRVAFNSDRDGNENLYVIDLENGELTQLTDHPADDIYAMWSLDGETILFVSERDHSLMTGQVDLFLMNADGSDLHLLGADETFLGDPTYSSDGAQVAYVSNEEGSWSIYVMDTGGGDARRITGTEANDLFPVWRPVPVESGEEGTE